MTCSPVVTYYTYQQIIFTLLLRVPFASTTEKSEPTSRDVCITLNYASLEIIFTRMQVWKKKKKKTPILPLPYLGLTFLDGLTMFELFLIFFYGLLSDNKLP